MLAAINAAKDLRFNCDKQDVGAQENPALRIGGSGPVFVTVTPILPYNRFESAEKANIATLATD